MNKKQLTFYAFMLTFDIACGDSSVKNSEHTTPTPPQVDKPHKNNLDDNATGHTTQGGPITQDDNVTQGGPITQDDNVTQGGPMQKPRFKIGDRVSIYDGIKNDWCHGKITKVSPENEEIKYSILFNDIDINEGNGIGEEYIYSF